MAHSAGGWLARAFLADEAYFDRGEGASAGPGEVHNRAVRSLVTLGAPHKPPPPEVMDMTGGALSWVHARWPGAQRSAFTLTLGWLGGVLQTSRRFKF